MRSSKGRIGRPPLLWLIATVTALGAVVLVAWWNTPSAYRRYVSPPLPDGTRYTLLYPATLEPTNWTPRSVNFHKPEETFAASVVKIVPLLLGARPAPERSEYLTVLHGPLKDRESGLPDSRQEVELVGGAGRHHGSRAVHIVDARARARFVLHHVISGQANDPRAIRVGPAVARSFRVLPPGATAPRP